MNSDCCAAGIEVGCCWAAELGGPAKRRRPPQASWRVATPVVLRNVRREAGMEADHFPRGGIGDVRALELYAWDWDGLRCGDYGGGSV